jgi:hypothetical protein
MIREYLVRPRNSYKWRLRIEYLLILAQTQPDYIVTIGFALVVELLQMRFEGNRGSKRT